MQIDLFNNSIKLSSNTPIRYFGGKQTARRNILSCFPSDMRVLTSPFIGGGSVELLAASRGIRVNGFDKFEPLVRLWKTLLKDMPSVAELTFKKYPYPAEYLKEFVTTGSQAMCIENDIEFASVAWAMTQQSYGSFFMNTNKFYDTIKHRGDNRSPCSVVDYFDPEKWKDWGNDNLHVECQSWEATLAQHPNDLLYVDPPYVGNEGKYGQHRNKDDFDHEGLAESLRNHSNGWVLSYVEHPLIKELYDGFEFVRPRWSQGSIAKSRKHDSAKELYIVKPPCFNPLNRGT